MENGNLSHILMALIARSVLCWGTDLRCWSIFHLPWLPVVQWSGQMLKCRWCFARSRATSHTATQPALQQSPGLYSLHLTVCS